MGEAAEASNNGDASGMKEAPSDDADGDVRSGMMDLSALDLAGVAEIVTNPVLAKVLRGIREEARNPDEAVAGFQSSTT